MQAEFKVIFALLIVLIILILDTRLHISDCLFEKLTISAKASQRDGPAHLSDQLYGRAFQA